MPLERLVEMNGINYNTLLNNTGLYSNRSTSNDVVQQYAAANARNKQTADSRQANADKDTYEHSTVSAKAGYEKPKSTGKYKALDSNGVQEGIKLSDNAKNLLEELRKKYGNMDISVAEWSTDEEQDYYAGLTDKDYSVLINPELLEKMAADDSVREQYESVLGNAGKASETLKEELGEDVEAPEDIQPPEDVPGLDDIQDTPQPPEDTPLDESQPPEDVTGPDDIQEPEPEDEPLEDPEPDPVPLEDLIDVLVPSSGELVINPYGLEVDMDGGVSTDQIVHSCQTLINLSDFPVIVDVSVTGTIPAESGAGFVSAPPAQDAPGQDVFLYAEFQPDPSGWVGEYWGLPYQVLADASGENVLTLEAGGEGYFRMFGAMSVYPEDPWSDTDTFGAVLSFTFTPVYPDPEPVEEPEAPEEEIPEAPETPDISEEEPPEDSETPEVPEEVPPEEPLPPDAPEEDPPGEITPPDVAEEDPVPPEEEPEAPDTPEPDTPEEPPEESSGSLETPEAEEPALPEDGVYTSKEDVALYIHLYGRLPSNFITKKEAQALGWPGGSLEPYAPGMCIGGSRFGNYEGLLPDADGRTFTECDIDTLGANSRGAKRIVFSNDGLIYYTEDHYESFTLLYGEET